MLCVCYLIIFVKIKFNMETGYLIGNIVGILLVVVFVPIGLGAIISMTKEYIDNTKLKK